MFALTLAAVSVICAFAALLGKGITESKLLKDWLWRHGVRDITVRLKSGEKITVQIPYDAPPDQLNEKVAEVLRGNDRTVSTASHG